MFDRKHKDIDKLCLLEVTYAHKAITKLLTMAVGMDLCGFSASSPVVAMMSKPIKA